MWVTGKMAGGAVVLVGPAAVVLVQGSRETPLTSARLGSSPSSHRPFDPKVPGGTSMGRMERRRIWKWHARVEPKSGLIGLQRTGAE